MEMWKVLLVSHVEGRGPAGRNSARNSGDVGRQRSRRRQAPLPTHSRLAPPSGPPASFLGAE